MFKFPFALAALAVACLADCSAGVCEEDVDSMKVAMLQSQAGTLPRAERYVNKFTYGRVVFPSVTVAETILDMATPFGSSVGFRWRKRDAPPDNKPWFGVESDGKYVNPFTNGITVTLPRLDTSLGEGDGGTVELTEQKISAFRDALRSCPPNTSVQLEWKQESKSLVGDCSDGENHNVTFIINATAVQSESIQGLHHDEKMIPRGLNRTKTWGRGAFQASEMRYIGQRFGIGSKSVVVKRSPRGRPIVRFSFEGNGIVTTIDAALEDGSHNFWDLIETPFQLDGHVLKIASEHMSTVKNELVKIHVYRGDGYFHTELDFYRYMNGELTLVNYDW